MRKRWQLLIAWADEYYDKDWRTIWFQPILCLMIFGVSIRLLLSPLDPPPFKEVLAADIYYGWLMMGVVSPTLVGVAWLLIRAGGRAGVMGRSVRLGADIGMFAMLLSFHIVTAKTGILTEARIFSRYILAAVMIFMLEVIVRDLWAIRLAERRFRTWKHG